MWPGPFGATMITSMSSGGVDPAVVDGEAVGEEDGRARARGSARPRRGRARPAARPGTSIATTCAPLHRLGDVLHRQPGLLGAAARGAVGPQADLDLDAGVGEVERVRVALAAVAEHRDLARQETRRPPS